MELNELHKLAILCMDGDINFENTPMDGVGAILCLLDFSGEVQDDAFMCDGKLFISSLPSQPLTAQEAFERWKAMA